MSNRVETTVTSVKRIRSSRDGNPRFQFTTSAGLFKTAPDTSAAYDVENHFNNINVETGVAAVLVLDGRNNVTDWVL